MSRRVVHLVDALPYVFRAYYSLPESLVDPSGRPVNAVRGFGDFLLRYFDEERPTHVAVCFDRSLTTSFRNELYPGYKAKRELPPPELAAQIEACEALAVALGAATFADARYEADDLIATLCHSLVKRGHSCVIVTNDKDLGQLVGPRVHTYDFARGERRDELGVRAKLGVDPKQIPDFLGLAGDAVDDIPGVRGVGVKTAVALMGKFAHLEELYADLGEVEKMPLRGAASIMRRLEEGREMAFLSRELATVARDAPVQTGLRQLAWRGPEETLVRTLVEQLGMERLLARIENLGRGG